MLTLRDNAVISTCGRYRYVLTRQVGPGSLAATFVMLNPSTADAMNDDPTIRRCIGYARQWGCGRLVVLNLFAFRATDPAHLKQADDPVGPKNREWLKRTLLAPHGGPVVCAWGVHGSFMDQDRTVTGWIDSWGIRPFALGRTRGGHPKHPLYLPKAARLIPYPG